jgi:hypothetical protein
VHATYTTPSVICDVMFIKLRRKKILSNLSGFGGKLVSFDTHSTFQNVATKIPTRLKKILSKSCEKTPTAIPVSLSKLYVTFCGVAAKLKVRITVCWNIIWARNLAGEGRMTWKRSSVLCLSLANKTRGNIADIVSLRELKLTCCWLSHYF